MLNIASRPNLPQIRFSLRKEATENVMVDILSLECLTLSLSLSFGFLTVPYCPFSGSVFGSLLFLFFHCLLPSVTFVIAADLQSEDALQTFCSNGRQLLEHIEAKL